MVVLGRMVSFQRWLVWPKVVNGGVRQQRTCKLG